MVLMFAKLLMGHAMADFALQSDWVATNKSRHFNHSPVSWVYVLSAHGLIHGFFVWQITQNIQLGIAESVVHAAIDFGKCEKWYGIHTDQALHFLSKLLWISCL